VDDQPPAEGSALSEVAARLAAIEASLHAARERREHLADALRAALGPPEPASTPPGPEPGTPAPPPGEPSRRRRLFRSRRPRQ